ncbi:MAG TPA: DNA alkylation repair protein [Bryobacteraceae bacterium]|jgi:3-methyladenine DNA glycosylase AlkD
MASRKTTELLHATLQKLSEFADPVFAEGSARFFKEPIKTRGVRSPQLIALSADLYREIKPWPVAERDTFVTGLWKDPHIESGNLACYLYRRFSKTFREREFHLFELWLERYATNWGHCDGLSVYLLAPSIAHVPELAQELVAWTKSKNQWKRRGAAVALVKEAHHGRHTNLIFKIASSLANDPEDLVQKGAGWLLKEAYPPRPREVVQFITKHKKHWPRLVLRYAAEKMSPQDKRAILTMGE